MKQKLLIVITAMLCALVFIFTGCSDPEGQQGQNDQTAPPPSVGQGKVLVAYFSATGNTEGVAEIIADTTGGTLFEIVPEVPYTDADLNYSNDDCRANREQNDENARPAIANEVEDMASYDKVFIGHPIWWGDAPRIIDTFLESYDFSGKTVIPFCTSGSSGIDASVENLKTLATDATWLDGQRFAGNATQEAVMEWVHSLDLNL